MVALSGFIALYREAFTHPVLKDAERFRAWFWLVAHAAWKPTRHDARGHTITVERGQICAGREQLARAWGWSPSSVERFLTRLETEHMIERQTGQMKTVITICNYDKYQSNDDTGGHMSGQQTGQKPDRNRTAKEEGKQGNKGEEEEPIGSPSSARASSDDQGELLAPEPEAFPPLEKPPRKAADETPLPDQFEPVLGPKRAAMVAGWPPGVLEEQIERFRMHAVRNRRVAKDWNAAFGTWADKADKGIRAYAQRGEDFGGSAPHHHFGRGGGDGFTRAIDRAEDALRGHAGAGVASGAARALE